MSRKLYWGSGSAFAWRILIALEEKGLEYESHLLSFSKGEHKQPPNSTLNRRGQVPTFVDGDLVICESGAVCQYLDEAYPDSGLKLTPSDIKQKAQALQYMYESTNLYQAFRPVMEHYFFSKGPVEETDEVKAMVAKLKVELQYWEPSLTGKKFLLGDAFTMADVFFYPFLATCVRWGLDLEKAGFPALAQYYATVTAMESVKKSWPPHWADGPGPTALKNL